MPSRPLPLAARLKRPVKSALFILKEVSTVQKKKAVPICQQGSIIYCIGLHQVNCELGQIITCIILLRRGNMTRHRINHKEVSLAQHTPAGLEYVTSATTLSLPHPPFSLNTPNALHLQKQLFGVITRNVVFAPKQWTAHVMLSCCTDCHRERNRCVHHLHWLKKRMRNWVMADLRLFLVWCCSGACRRFTVSVFHNISNDTLPLTTHHNAEQFTVPR